ncbi:MAG: metallophosphoesterase [Vicinamibacterales bacterium]
MSDSGRPGRRFVLKSLIGLGVGSTTGVAAWGYFYERQRLFSNTSRVPIAGLPSALHGLRIALLTDLHRSEAVSDEFIRSAVGLARAARPDVVVLGGDYVSFGDRRFMQASAETLSGLTAPNGVFAVMGNHDDDREMPAALKRQGVEVLRDARTTVSIHGQPVDFIGLRFWSRRRDILARILAGAEGFPILLAHDPRRLPDAASLRIPLVLSGHTHGGQVRLPGLTAITARKFPVLAGLGYEGPTTLFVSRGVGTIYVPVRVNCPPEVSILELVPRAAPAPPS